MTPERWRQIDQLYHAVLDQNTDERAAFLSRVCAGDADLLQEVESLVASHQQAGSLIAEPALKFAAKMLAGDGPSSRVGQTLSHYRIESLLGMGGMGEVYLAEDTNLGRKVALKLLPDYLSKDAERLRRFKQEARAASVLSHPNIVTVHEIGTENSTHFITTEFVEGATLRERMKVEALKLDSLLDIAAQIASALSAAHDAGIVHRDIKPENIMVRRDGLVKILDFGLAKQTSNVTTNGTLSPPRSIDETNPGALLGTVRYMSPEQARGQEVDARTDIWSLGVVLYEMITTRHPFAGETPSDVIVSILESQPPSLDESEVPRELEEIVGKTLRKKKEERYATASKLAHDLKSLRQELEIGVRLKPSIAQDEPTETIPMESSKPPAGRTEIVISHATSTAEYPTSEIKRNMRRVALAAAAVILVLVALSSSFLNGGRGGPAGRLEPIDSVMVLPLVNEGGDINTEYLADAITDSIINSLSRLPKLRVISHSAAFRYKGKQIDPQSVGREVNVRAVLVGQMRQQGNNLTITAELVNVQDNTRLWAAQYDRQIMDVLALQQEIARKVSERLRLPLTGEERKELDKQPTANANAYLLDSLGRYEFEKNTKAGFQKSIDYYDQAIKVDAEYAPAYVGLSKSYFEMAWRGFSLPKDALRKAEWAAQKAVEADESLSDAHVVLAVAAKNSWKWTSAEREYKRALEIDSKSAFANRHYSTHLAFSGRAHEALTYAERASESDPVRLGSAFLGFIRLIARQYDRAIEDYSTAVQRSPKNPHFQFLLGEAYLANGVYDKSITALRRAVALDPSPERWDRFPVLAHVLAVSGNRKEALKILSEQTRLAKQRYISAYNFAIISIGLGDKDQAFRYLNKAIDEGMPLKQVADRPLFDSIRSDERYPELLRRIAETM